MEEPWGTCDVKASPTSNCVHKCNKRQSEIKCGCRDAFVDFTPLNITVSNLRNGSYNYTTDSTIIDSSVAYGRLTKNIRHNVLQKWVGKPAVSVAVSVSVSIYNLSREVPLIF